MSATSWYYCDAGVDPERAFGPVSVDRLGELIRTGQLPYDVLVSTEDRPGSKWIQADTVAQILDAIPLDRERLMQEFIRYGEAPPGEEHWGWASDRMYSLLRVLPERAWPLISEMIERAPSDAALGFIAASPLEDLLSDHGPAFITHVEERAARSAQFRRALGMLRRLGMTDDVWRRVQRAAQLGT